jgi:hypothetical protein
LHSNAFNKKKGGPTLKYQVVTHHSIRKPLHIYGPFKESIHDARVYEKIDITKYLLNHTLKLIEDKAYMGWHKIAYLNLFFDRSSLDYFYWIMMPA